MIPGQDPSVLDALDRPCRMMDRLRPDNKADPETDRRALAQRHRKTFHVVRPKENLNAARRRERSRKSFVDDAGPRQMLGRDRSIRAPLEPRPAPA